MLFIIAAVNVIFVFTVLYLEHAGFTPWSDNATYLAFAIVIMAALLLRTCFFDFVSFDYRDFLSGWVEQFRQNGGIAGLSQSIGDYNVPYMLLLALFSYIPVNDLFLIKIVSVIFDVILACGIMRLVNLVTGKKKYAIAAFIVTLYLPTVLLNSACWGQCDSVVFAFSVFGLFYGLNRNPVKCVIMFAIGFSIKITGVFLLPMLLILLFCGKIKLRHLAVFPVVFAVMILPAILAGRPVLEVLSITLAQTSLYDGYLQLNTPNLFAFLLGTAPFESFKHAGMLISGVFIVVMSAVAFRLRDRLGNPELLMIAVLFSICIPYLLPSMHERYFYLADVLAAAYACTQLRTRWIVAALVVVASFNSYNAYLFGGYVIELKHAAILPLAAAVIVGYQLFKTTRSDAITKCGKPEITKSDRD